MCGEADLLYRTGDAFPEGHFGFPHHTGTAVFPLHPLKQQIRTEPCQANPREHAASSSDLQFQRVPDFVVRLL